MKPQVLLLAATLLVSCRLAAEDIAVFGNGDFSRTGDASSDPARAGFLGSVAAALSGSGPADASYALINPPDWGKTVSAESTGRLSIVRSFAGGFVFHLDIEHLQPGHAYRICINGRPKHPGNELLPESVTGHESEKYYDFYTLTTDARGAYHGGFALRLKPGAYNVHFYVKDTADFKIVLYGLEYFDFAVR